VAGWPVERVEVEGMTLDCWCAGDFIDLPGWLFYGLSGWSLELWEATGLLIAPEVLLLVLAGGAALCGVVLPLVLVRMACARRLARLVADQRQAKQAGAGSPDQAR